jgi:hypothetical protein
MQLKKIRRSLASLGVSNPNTFASYLNSRPPRPKPVPVVAPPAVPRPAPNPAPQLQSPFQQMPEIVAPPAMPKPAPVQAPQMQPPSQQAAQAAPRVVTLKELKEKSAQPKLVEVGATVAVVHPNDCDCGGDQGLM